MFGRLAVLFCALSLLACARADEEQPTEAELAALPDQESWDAVLRIDEAGLPLLVLEAPYLARYDRRDSVFTRFGSLAADTSRVRATLYDDAGAQSALVEADRLTYHDQERRFEAQGRVRVITPGGRRLESEQVDWDEDSRQLRAPGFFRFTSPAERIQGVGLVAAEDLSRYAFRQASGELEVEE